MSIVPVRVAMVKTFAPDLSITIAHHSPITEYRALARVHPRGFHAFDEYQPGRRHDTHETARGSRDS